MTSKGRPPKTGKQWSAVGRLVDRHESHAARNLIVLMLLILGLIVFYAMHIRGVF